MPRIEIVPQNWETSQEKKSGDGTPTIDVCWSCSEAFVENEPIPDDIIEELEANKNLYGNYRGGIVGSTEVAHPPYEDAFEGEEYKCACCKEELTPQDN